MTPLGIRCWCAFAALAAGFSLAQAQEKPLGDLADPAQVKKPDQPGEAKPDPAAAARQSFTQLVERMIRVPDGIELSAEQQQRLAALRKEYAPRLMAALKAQSDVLKPEQKQAAATAQKEALAAGKEPAEVARLVQAALNLTDEQRAARQKVATQQAALRAEVFQKLEALLTPEQKAELERRKKAPND